MSNRVKAFIELFFASIFFWVLAFQLFITVRYNGLAEELSVYTDENLGLPIVAFYQYAILLGILLGIFYAIIEFIFDEYISKRLILGVSIVVKSLMYFTLIIIVLSSMSFLIEEQIDIDLPNEKGWWRDDPFFWNTVIYFVTGSIVFSLIRIMNDKFGRGVFLNVLLGKYRKPQEEERVLMFIDLKDSTKIAEHLGHIRYSKFIQDCFEDLNKVLTKYEAEVYQYVGDEAVMTWTAKKGFRKNNCIELFFAFQNRLNKRKLYYEENYNYLPEFKSGIHFGKLMIAEVGSIKKEIAYHGDVINTASRIQKLCNSYNASLLISEATLTKLIKSERFKPFSKGIIELKGKENAITIFEIMVYN